MSLEINDVLGLLKSSTVYWNQQVVPSDAIVDVLNRLFREINDKADNAYRINCRLSQEILELERERSRLHQKLSAKQTDDYLKLGRIVEELKNQ